MSFGVHSFAAPVQQSLGFHGQLYTNNTPSNDSIQTTFTFYTSATGTVPTGTPFTKIIPVVNGYVSTLFSETDTQGVDFNQQLYLEVEINGTTLSPRTTVNPTVASLKSFGTFSYDTPPTPGVAGSLYFNTTTNELYVSTGSIWQLAGVSSSTTQWTPNGTSLTYMAGNVGVGTTSPSAKLMVQGDGNGTNKTFSVVGNDNTTQFTVTDNGNILAVGSASSSLPFDFLTNHAIVGQQGTLRFRNSNAQGAAGFQSANSMFDSFRFQTYGPSYPTLHEIDNMSLARWAHIEASSGFNGLLIETRGAAPILFNTSKIERMRVHSNGNIGIGTTTPGDKLSVAGTFNLTGAFKANGNAGTLGQLLQTTATGTQWVSTSSLGLSPFGTLGQVAYFSGTNTVSGTSSLFIAANGNVGVGTTNPAAKLQVNGNLTVGALDGNGYAQQGVVYLNTTPQYQSSIRDNGGGVDIVSPEAFAQLFHQEFTPNSDKSIGLGSLLYSRRWSFVYADNGYFSGNVGIGTTTPNYNLDVVGNAGVKISRALNPDQNLVLIGGNGSGMSTVQSSVELSINSGGGYPISFKTGGTDKMTILNNGNVGIGTTTPSDKLTVLGTGSFTGAVTLSGNLVANAIVYTRDIRAGSTNGSLSLMGSDRTDSAKIVLQGLSAGSDIQFLTDPTNSVSAATIQMVIKKSGNVGIGTSTPDAKLDIKSASSTLKGLVIQGAASQSANLQEWQTSAGTAVTSINSSGYLTWAGGLGYLGAGGEINTYAGVYGNQARFGLGINGPGVSNIGPGYQFFNANSISSGPVSAAIRQLSPGVLEINNGTGGLSTSTQLVVGSFIATSTTANSIFMGNVGIGTVSPTAKLDVVGNINTSGILTLGSVSVGSGNSGAGAAGNLNMIFGVHNTNNLGDGGNRNSLFGYGNSFTGAVNSSSNSMFGNNNIISNAGTIAFSGVFGNNNTITGGNGAFAFGYGITNNLANSVMIGPSDSAKMTILSSGNIGIGTTTPEVKLSVSGSIASTDLLGGLTTLSVDASGNIIRTPSDQSLKTNIETLTSALDKVNQMRGVSYTWIDTARFGTSSEIGFIAQELEPIVPEVVKSGGEYKSVNYQNLVALLVEAIKELSGKFDGMMEVVKTKFVDTDKVKTKELCIGETCITEEEFKDVLRNRNSNSNTSTPTSSPTPTQEPEVIEETPEEEPTPDVPVEVPVEAPLPTETPTE